MSKSCTWCGGIIPEDRRKLCSTSCKRKASVTKWRRRIKRRAVAYLGGKCKRCGYNGCVAAMCFHHVSGKTFRIGSGSGRSWKRIKAELDRCTLLCLNCHAEKHYIEVDPRIENEQDGDITLWAEAERAPKHPPPESQCMDCEAPVTRQAMRCRSCAAKMRPPKIRWPSVATLQKRVGRHGYEAVGRKLGVSGNAVRKRIRTRKKDEN